VEAMSLDLASLASVRAFAADLIEKPFIANPDLVERFKSDLPLSDPDPATLYQGGADGYITYKPSNKELAA